MYELLKFFVFYLQGDVGPPGVMGETGTPGPQVQSTPAGYKSIL